MTYETKRLRDVELKQDGDEGRIEAVFATLDVVDHDGDVTLPGAFAQGAEVVVGAYQHATASQGRLPVGKGAIRVRGNEAMLTGRLFLDTTLGAETFTTLKALGDLAEWSYVYQVIDSEPGAVGGRPVRFLKRLDVWSVDPVLRGAGIGTRTTVVKSNAAGMRAGAPPLRQLHLRFMELNARLISGRRA